MRPILAILVAAVAAAQSPAPILDRTPDPAKEPKAATWTPLRVAVRGLKVAYAGALHAPRGVTRSRDEARDLAAALAIRARAKDGDLAALATQWSDDAWGRARGGFLGTIRLKKDQSALEKAMLKVRVGAVVGEMETPEGFFVAERIPVEELAFDAIVVAWKGAEGAKSNVIRSQPEASTRAEEIATRVREAPETFDAVARAESDDRGTAERGGAFAPAPRGDLDPRLEDLLLTLEPGAVGAIVETARGYLVVRRASVEWITADLILIAYRGAKDAPVTQLRSKDDALRFAAEVLDAVRKPRADVPAIAKETSDDTMAKVSGPRRTMAVGRGSAPFVHEVARLAVGEASVIESPLGIYVVRRVELDRD